MENWNKWKTCKHKWHPNPKISEYGTVYQDECSECGAIGVMADKPDANGFWPIVAQPMADVVDFLAYKRRKEEKANEQAAKETIGG